MKTLHLIMVIVIPIAFFSGMAFVMFVTPHASNELNSDTKSQVESISGSQDNGSSYAIVNPNTNRIYVANEVGKTVSVIDGNTNEKIADIQLDTMPSQLAINPNTNRIYVMEHRFVNNIEENSTVGVIDGNTNEKIADIPVGAYSQIAVNPNTNLIYIAERHLINNIEENNIEQNGTVSVMDGNANTKIANMSIGPGSFGIDINPNTNRIYVLHRHFAMIDNKWQNGTVSVIDGNTYTKIASIPVGANPAGIAVNSNTNRIYVTNYQAGTISVIDGINDKIMDKSIQLDPGVEGIAINPLTNKIYAADGIDTTLYVIDGNTGSKKSEIRVGGWSVAVNPTTNRIFVPDYFFNNLSVIDGKYDDIMTVIQMGVYPN
ncbi:MAG: YncE family protein [Candidatus Nitrosotalea sp.]|nr:YncE family protein [Candidatus Nitrosotalea sp.]